MDKINISESQKNSFLYFIIYSGIIVIFVLIVIVPLYLKISNYIQENEKLNYQIKEQKELKPVYASLLNSMKGKDFLSLPHPEKTTIPRSEAGKFQDDFLMIAKKSGLTMLIFSRDLTTLTGSSTSLLYNIVVRGEFTDFRKLLIGLGSVPYLDRIEEINIQQNADSMEFKMKVWIAVK